MTRPTRPVPPPDRLRQHDRLRQPPAASRAYIRASWRTYGKSRETRIHWCYPDLRFGARLYRALCGIKSTETQAVTAPGVVCAKCATRYAKIIAQYDADHTQAVPEGVESR